MNTRPSVKFFAVIGNPVEHSRSPAIHTQFGLETGIPLDYQKIACQPEAFTSTVEAFFSDGGSGLNVTVPFKEDAWQMAHAHLSPRARVAGAVNTLWMQEGQLHGCNTDGEGLLLDLRRLGHDPEDKNILLVGAGGAAKGVVFPLLEAGCRLLHIVNRTPEKAHQLADHARQHLPQAAQRLDSGSLDGAAGQWDIVINATSSSLQQSAPSLPGVAYAANALAYDMVYAATPTPFLQQAKASGAAHCADGLGMLVAQAAASFAIWNSISPSIEPVLKLIREQLHQS